MTELASPLRPMVFRPLSRLLIVIAVAAVVCTLLLKHVLWINGTYFNRWEWQRVAATRIYPAMLLMALPAIVAQWVRHRGVMLALLSVSLLSMQLVSVGMPHDPWSLDRLTHIVMNPGTTSYYSDAQRYLRLIDLQSLPTFLKLFPELAQYCRMHAREKAPGQILYYMAWLRGCGPMAQESAALMGGIGVMTLAALAVPCVYWMARLLELGREAAKATATYFALLPGMVVITPTFDGVHAAFTGLIIGTWLVALSRSGWKSVLAASACGLITAVSSFLAYAPLTLGAICVGLAILRCRQGRATLSHVIRAAGGVVAILAAMYGLLWLWSGFDPIQMYIHATINERGNMAGLPLKHVYPYTLPSDLKDFMLAAGWIALPLILFGTLRARRSPLMGIVVLSGLQVAIVWVSGLLKCETARIWLFLQPLALIPVGIELAVWPKSLRVTTYVVLAVVTTCMSQNLVFMPEWG